MNIFISRLSSKNNIFNSRHNKRKKIHFTLIFVCVRASVRVSVASLLSNELTTFDAVLIVLKFVFLKCFLNIFASFISG